MISIMQLKLLNIRIKNNNRKTQSIYRLNMPHVKG